MGNNKKLNKNLGTAEGGKFLFTNEDGGITTIDIVATKDELGYLEGATSNIQEQLNNKSSSSHSHTIRASASDDDVVVLTGTNGSNEVAYTASHATSGVAAGTYKSVTVNEYGHITSGTNPTTLSDYGIVDAVAQSTFDDLSNTVNNMNDTKADKSAIFPTPTQYNGEQLTEPIKLTESGYYFIQYRNDGYSSYSYNFGIVYWNGLSEICTADVANGNATLGSTIYGDSAYRIKIMQDGTIKVYHVQRHYKSEEFIEEGLYVEEVNYVGSILNTLCVTRLSI